MADRREARQFEPPPWEVEQFEQLKKQEPVAAAPAQPEHDGLSETPMREVSPESGEPGLEPIQPQAGAQGDETGQGASTDEANGLPEEARVIEMMAQLAAEEPRTDHVLITAGTVAAAVFAAMGLVIMIWGGAAIASSGRVGGVALAGGAGMLAIGGLFLGVGSYIVWNNLRKRGFI